MTFRLAMLDLDGTLLHVGDLKPGATDILERLDAAGVVVALCSGRSLEAMHLTAADLPQVSFLAAGGGSIVQARDDDGWRTIGERFLTIAQVSRVAEVTAHHGMELWAYTSSQWLIPARSQRTDFEERFTGVTPVVAPLVGRSDVAKLLTFADSPAHERVLETLGEAEGVSVVSSFEGADAAGVPGLEGIPAYFDVIPEASAQTKGGDVLIEALGIGWSDVLAMGDGPNDLGMLSRAGTALLMPPRTVAELDAPRPGQDRRALRGLHDALALLGDRGM